MIRRITIKLLIAFLGIGSVTARAEQDKYYRLAQQLDSLDRHAREQAEAALIEAGKSAVPALIAECCQNLIPSDPMAAACLRILKRWETDSWSDSKSAAAVEEFIRLARSDERICDSNRPLISTSRVPFGEAVRVLDVSAEKAKERIIAHGGKVSVSPFGAVTVTLAFWHGSPSDFMYIANLAPPNPRRDLTIELIREDESSVFLTECLKFLRKARTENLCLNLHRPMLDKEGWLVLSKFPNVRHLTVPAAAEDVEDPHIAQTIAQFSVVRHLLLPPPTGPKTISVVARVKSLEVLTLIRPWLTEEDLEPLRGHERLRGFTVLGGEGNVQRYLHSDGTGRWDRPTDTDNASGHPRD